MRRKLFIKTFVTAILLLCALQLFWPNVVHEPMHLAALWVQGSDGYISFDWSFPAEPTTTRIEPVRGVAGGLFFMLAPTILHLGILIALWKRTSLGSFIMVHFLLFDMYLNVRGWKSAFNDFRFLQAMEFGGLLAYTMILTIFGMVMLYNVQLAKRTEKTDKVIK